ncbi:MAG: DUF2905 domain-containing protein [Candidatus Omnitrophica bacterium]|nr:DUF2905 domain-containing protein [Candidatus Omnitrophota bacterium]
MSGLSKILIFMGALLILAGAVFYFIGKVPYVGRLPGDIYIQRKNFTFYFPLTTSIIVSIIISFILWLWSRR